MTRPEITKPPVVRTGMLIRKPAQEVFEAFVDPEVTTRFWFTQGSGRLAAGKRVQWDWEMYGISVPVTVKALEPHKRILIEWDGGGGPTTVEWTFTPCEGGTFVAIAHSGFQGSGDELVQMVADSSQGFSFVLAALKALLEHGARLNLVADRLPKDVAAR